MIWIISLVLLGAAVSAWMFWPGKKYPETCFTPENFDSVMKYVEWKDRTSKIGKVLVNGFVVKIENSNQLVFRKDKTTTVAFTITRDKKIELVEVNKAESLKRKAEGTFCELLERAKLRGY